MTDFNPATSADDVIYIGERKYLAVSSDLANAIEQILTEVIDVEHYDCAFDFSQHMHDEVAPMARQVKASLFRRMEELTDEH